MALHIGYETLEPWPLRRIDVPDAQEQKAGLEPGALLRADKSGGVIVLDTETQLTGIPVSAWDYRLGNRSALEWVLDQYKEKTPRDPTIRERFNTYRFADYKDKVIDLLGRVTRVSVETSDRRSHAGGKRVRLAPWRRNPVTRAEHQRKLRDLIPASRSILRAAGQHGRLGF